MDVTKIEKLIDEATDLLGLEGEPVSADNADEVAVILAEIRKQIKKVN